MVYFFHTLFGTIRVLRYERQSRSTLGVFLLCFFVIEIGVFIPSLSVVYGKLQYLLRSAKGIYEWAVNGNTLILFTEVYSLPVQMTLFAFYLSIGIVVSELMSRWSKTDDD